MFNQLKISPPILFTFSLKLFQNDGGALDVHIHLGSVPGGHVESEAQMRLNHARRMIRLANETLDQLEVNQAHYNKKYEQHRKKTGLQGFRPGPAQIVLYSHRR